MPFPPVNHIAKYILNVLLYNPINRLGAHVYDLAHSGRPDDAKALLLEVQRKVLYGTPHSFRWISPFGIFVPGWANYNLMHLSITFLHQLRSWEDLAKFTIAWIDYYGEPPYADEPYIQDCLNGLEEQDNMLLAKKLREKLIQH